MQVLDHPTKVVRRNSFWLLFARLTSQGFTLLFVAIAARRLGVSDFGLFSVIISLVVIGNIFTSFGTDPYIVRETAQIRRSPDIIPHTLTLQLFLSLLWWLFLLVIRSSPILLLYSLVLFPQAIFSITIALMRGFERMELFWSVSLANGLIQLLAAIVSKDVWMLCLMLLLGQTILAFVSTWLCSLSFAGFRLFPLSDFRPLLTIVWPFAALTTIASVSQRLGILSISFFMGNEASGLFSSIVRVVDSLKVGHLAILGALLPALTRRTKPVRTEFLRAFIGLFSISLLLAGGVSTFAPGVLTLLFGSGFISAAPSLRVLSWSLLPYTISAFLSVELIARRDEQKLLFGMFLSLIGLGIFYIWLVPRFGVIGGSIAALAGEFIQAVVLLSLAGFPRIWKPDWSRLFA